MMAERLDRADLRTEAFAEGVRSLKGILGEVRPLQVLATLAHWGLSHAVGPDGVAEKSLIPDLSQHHVEILQALILSLPPEAWGTAVATPLQIQKVIDLLKEVGAAFHEKRARAVLAAKTPQAGALLSLQERIRTHTQVIRNWGYFGDVLTMVRSLYSPLDARMADAVGVSASQMIEVMEALVRVLEERKAEQFVILKSVFAARDVRRLVCGYFEQYAPEDDPEAYLSAIPRGTPIRTVREWLLVHADQSRMHSGLVSIDEIAAAAGVQFEIAGAVLERLCEAPGALVGTSPERFFMDNPVWTAPGVKLGNGGFFFAAPQIAFSFIHAIMARVCSEAGLDEALSRRRTTYLEKEVERQVRRAFPQARVLAGAKWRWEGAAYETDCLAVIDRTLVIVEAKSAALTPQGLRGAEGRLKRHVDDLIVDAALQSARLEMVLGRAREGDAAARAVAEELGLDVEAIQRVVRISVTLDDFSAVSSAELELKLAGLCPAEVELPATLSIADMRCVVDLLQPIHVLHYFHARGRLQRQIRLVADELDLLGFYLASRFNLSSLPATGGIVLTGMSAAVDRYYINRDADAPSSPPTLAPSPVLDSVVRGLQELRPKGWTTKAIDLLDAGSLAEMEELSRRLEKIRREVARRKPDKEGECALVWAPPEPARHLVLFLVFTRRQESLAEDVAADLAAEALMLSGRDRCLVVARRVETWDAPYAFVGTFRRQASLFSGPWGNRGAPHHPGRGDQGLGQGQRTKGQ